MGSVRWRKVVRDLGTHKLRSLLVVLSIAVGVFAIGTIAGADAWLREYSSTNVTDGVGHFAAVGDSKCARALATDFEIAAAGPFRTVATHRDVTF